MLEKAGVIVRSVSPWASPIVIVPKKTAPGEPPRHRMCMDYRVLNSLLPCVDKAHSKAKPSMAKLVHKRVAASLGQVPPEKRKGDSDDTFASQKKKYTETVSITVA